MAEQQNVLPKTYLFIDESGDHGLTKIDTDFPVFLLSGILITKEDYEAVRQSINKASIPFGAIKKSFFIPVMFVNAKRNFRNFLTLN